MEDEFFHKLFINVYLQAQCYGGPEEGGWYYNIGKALASAPILAEMKDGHDDGCYNCQMARHGVEGHSFCRNIPDSVIEAWEEADTSSFSDEQLADWERSRKRWEQEYPICHHLVPKDPETAEKQREELRKLFASEANPRSHTEIVVLFEESFAKDYNDYEPYS